MAPLRCRRSFCAAENRRRLQGAASAATGGCEGQEGRGSWRCGGRGGRRPRGPCGQGVAGQGGAAGRADGLAARDRGASCRMIHNIFRKRALTRLCWASAADQRVRRDGLDREPITRGAAGDAGADHPAGARQPGHEAQQVRLSFSPPERHSPSYSAHGGCFGLAVLCSATADRWPSEPRCLEYITVI